MTDVLAVKTDALLRCLRRIESKLPLSITKLEEDFDVQDIIVLNLERAVQQSVDIAMHLLAQSGQRVPETMRDSFDALFKQGHITSETAEKMKHAVGFRNVAVHTYQQINWDIVHSVIHHHLNDFRDFLKEISPVVRP
ncbi:MAG: DUF86 domain-containing protein [Spartobacteria bacterium]|nr:DUF86 domain-containing protein [Spartobacteria bacterium]